jgi:predicted amidohydrolase YtcJ
MSASKAASSLRSAPCCDANGCALLPGLHDHHLHFLAYAASLDSVQCGPPHVHTAAQLRDVLQRRAHELPAGRWLRGIGYHESVAGAIDRRWLDAVVPDAPVRIQQRSGRLWIFNSCALGLLGDLREAPLERDGGDFTGRLFDADPWLRSRIGRQMPDVRRASRELARFGITGFTDTTPSNDAATFAQFARLQADGSIVQRVAMMGDASLADCESAPRLYVGATKVHLHDSDLPELDTLCAAIARSHGRHRPVAIHCVTLTELVFALEAFRSAGSRAGDRIEHAAIAPPDLLGDIAALRLTVATQPNFIAERGDAYLRDVEPADQPWLYRLRGFLDAGVPLAAGSDAPFGAPDPWAAMQAAVMRRTAGGRCIGETEALPPEQALELFLGDPLRPGFGRNGIETGQRADLCLLDRPWREARRDLAAVRAAMTLCEGVVCN